MSSYCTSHTTYQNVGTSRQPATSDVERYTHLALPPKVVPSCLSLCPLWLFTQRVCLQALLRVRARVYDKMCRYGEHCTRDELEQFLIPSYWWPYCVLTDTLTPTRLGVNACQSVTVACISRIKLSWFIAKYEVQHSNQETIRNKMTNLVVQYLLKKRRRKERYITRFQPKLCISHQYLLIVFQYYQEATMVLQSNGDSNGDSVSIISSHNI